MINDQLKRSSVRNFSNKAIEKEKLETIKKVINNVPTAKNFQCFSAIFITDTNTKQALSSVNWNQKHVVSAPLIILFCADNNRLDKSYDNRTTHNFDEYVWSVVDATIAATQTMDCCIELGLGTCFLGGIRFGADKVKEILHLEGSVVPVLGLAIGYPEKVLPPRPKVNKVFNEVYSIDQLNKEFDEYDKLMHDWYLKIFNKNTSFKQINVQSLDSFDVNHDLEVLHKLFKLEW